MLNLTNIVPSVIFPMEILACLRYEVELILMDKTKSFKITLIC